MYARVSMSSDDDDDLPEEELPEEEALEKSQLKKNEPDALRQL